MGAAGKPVVGKPCALPTARGHGAGLLLLRLNARIPRSLSRGTRWAHTLDAVGAWALRTPGRRLHSAPSVAEVRGSFDARVGAASVALCDSLAAADECVEGGDASPYRMVPYPYGSDGWPRADFGPPRCVGMSDLTDPKLVLAA